MIGLDFCLVNDTKDHQQQLGILFSSSTIFEIQQLITSLAIYREEMEEEMQLSRLPSS